MTTKQLNNRPGGQDQAEENDETRSQLKGKPECPEYSNTKPEVIYSEVDSQLRDIQHANEIQSEPDGHTEIETKDKAETILNSVTSLSTKSNRPTQDNDSPICTGDDGESSSNYTKDEETTSQVTKTKKIIKLNYTDFVKYMTFSVDTESMRQDEELWPMSVVAGNFLQVTYLSTLCELRLVYRMLSGKSSSNAATVAGDELHIARELEVNSHTFEEPSCLEDSIAIYAYRLLHGVMSLLNGSTIARRVPVFGLLRPKAFVIGGIDDITLDKEKNELNILEFKTRRSKSLPVKALKVQNTTQVMLYKKLLEQLIQGKVSKQHLVDTLQIDLSKPLNVCLREKPFIKDNGFLNLDQLLDFTFKKCLALPRVTKIRIEYCYQGDCSRIALEEVIWNDVWLDNHIDHRMLFWKGERKPEGVPIEEAWSCKTCQFTSKCQWKANNYKQLVKIHCKNEDANNETRTSPEKQYDESTFVTENEAKQDIELFQPMWKLKNFKPKPSLIASQDARNALRPIDTLRKGHLFVSDLVHQYACEQQMVYELSRKNVHEMHNLIPLASDVPRCRELEAHDLVTKEVNTEDDRWAVRAIELIRSVKALLEGSATIVREVPVFGLVNHGIFVLGIVNEISVKKISLDSKADKIEIEILEMRTKNKKNLPRGMEREADDMQMMLYKKLLDGLIMGQITKRHIADHFHIDLSKPFDPDIAELVDRHKLPCANLGELLDLAFKQCRALPFVSHMSIEYCFWDDLSVIGMEAVKWDGDWLDSQLEYFLRYWRGIREPRGIASGLCNICQFAPICKWKRIDGY